MSENKKLNADLTAPLLDWYGKVFRPFPWRNTTDFYRVLVSEIMLQQTRAETVVPYYERFLLAFPDAASLSNAAPDEVFKLWEGLGYYSRAKNLKKAAESLAKAGAYPDTVEGIAKLPGVGPYTAGALASVVHNLPCPAVDGNVLRVVARLLNDETDVLSVPARKNAVAYLTPLYEKTPHRGTLTQALMELGACVCTPKNPKCGDCPVAAVCAARKAGRQSVLPIRKNKTKKTHEYLTVFVMTNDGKTALKPRPDSGLLAGLYELPNTPGTLDEQAAAAYLSSNGISGSLTQVKNLTHIFTHKVWHMTGYYIAAQEKTAGFFWTDTADTSNAATLPTAFKKFLY